MVSLDTYSGSPLVMTSLYLTLDSTGTTAMFALLISGLFHSGLKEIRISSAEWVASSFSSNAVALRSWFPDDMKPNACSENTASFTQRARRKLYDSHKLRLLALSSSGPPTFRSPAKIRTHGDIDRRKISALAYMASADVSTSPTLVGNPSSRVTSATRVLQHSTGGLTQLRDSTMSLSSDLPLDVQYVRLDHIPYLHQPSIHLSLWPLESLLEFIAGSLIRLVDAGFSEFPVTF